MFVIGCIFGIVGTLVVSVIACRVQGVQPYQGKHFRFM